MRKRDNKYAEALLSVIKVAGIITVAVVAPNALTLLGTSKKSRNTYKPKSYINQKLKRLVKDGYLFLEKKDGKDRVSLTPKGEVALKWMQNVPKKNIKWDKKWRVVIFDVFENQKSKRNLLRFELKQYGFIQLQRSVWIYPYPCSDFIALLKADLAFGKNIRYMVVEHLDNDQGLKKYFKLV